MREVSTKTIINSIRRLLDAYQSGSLGDTTMPEDTHPNFETLESKRIYYTLPMALNYQRNSYKLWEAAKKTFEDLSTNQVFDLERSAKLTQDELRVLLLRYKLALQPNKHIDTWSRISTTIFENWGTITKLFESNNSDYNELKECIQKRHKKGFPYLSGSKIFNYWMYVMTEYGELKLKNRHMIEIAPDTHVIQASVKLGIISKDDVKIMSRDDISTRWRELLDGTGIDPIDVHSPLWFWSRSGFSFDLNS